MPGTYYDIDLTKVLALAVASDVSTDDGNTQDGASPALRLARRKILYHARQLKHAESVDPRVNVDRTRILVEIDQTPPHAVVVAGPMDRVACLAYLATDPAWSNG